MNIKKIYKNCKGLSILEVVVSLGVITVGMIGILSLIVQSSQVYYNNKSKFVATMLAQEGIELVRNKRDSNWLAGLDWNNGINLDNYCIDIDGNILAVSGIDDSNARLKIDGDNYYQYTSGANTPYYRIIEKTNIDVNSDGTVDGYKLICKIKWSERGNTHNFSAESYLFNWK